MHIQTLDFQYFVIAEILKLFELFPNRAFRGKHVSLVVRFPNQGRQVEDLDIWSHTNDTIGSVRRCILSRIKANSAHTKVELFIGGELVDPADDRKLIGQLNLKDKTVSTILKYIFIIIVRQS